MNENNNNIKNKNCLNSISFTLIGAFIITFESISLVMSILCLVMTSWNFLKIFIQVLNIISLIIIFSVIIINFLIFLNIKNERFDILHNYQKRMCLSFILVFLYIIIFIFNIFNAIYLTIRLHIADYPEYGGRKRDQNYIDEHPDEFGNVSLKEFIIVGFCPSIISVLNFICIILCVLFRKKMIITYDMMKEEENKRENEIVVHRNNHKHHNRNRIKRKYYNQNMNTNTNEEMIKNNNTEPNKERNTNRPNEDKNSIKIKINNSEDGEEHVQNKPLKLISYSHSDSNEESSSEKKENNFDNHEKNVINSMLGTKSSMNDKNVKEGE